VIDIKYSSEPESQQMSDQQDREIERTKSMVNWALRDLAANVLRVVRGSGEPYRIFQQAEKFVEAYRAADAMGLWPVHLIDVNGLAEPCKALYGGLSSEEYYTLPIEERERGRYESQIISGALQVAASELLGQATQCTKGHSEIWDAVMGIQRLNEDHRKQRDGGVAPGPIDATSSADTVALFKARLNALAPRKQKPKN
jgi:hypothetical protein